MARVSIRDFGSGSIRLRIVREGFDADDLGTPANQVILDSDAAGSMPVHQAGIVSIAGARTHATGPLATWPSLGFVPLVTSHLGKDGVFFPIYPSSSPGTVVNVYATETELRADVGGSYLFPVDLLYIVWAVRVT